MWNILLEVLNLNFKPFEELEFSDDFMFGKIMQNPEICGGVIERLLHIKVNRIEFPKLQNTIKPYYTSKGVRFDVYLKDSDRVFDIEIQTTTPVALGKRMRYYQSIIDMDSTMKGDDYSELKAFLNFVCSNKAEDDFTEQIQNLVNQAKLMEANKTEYMNIHEMDIRRNAKEEAKIEAAKLLIEKYNIPIEQACADLGISPELLKKEDN